ncbi:MAG: hypothetical protein J6B32_08470, partial [Spirochaetaceae bacterium]|nr:hypothetical protein [Spirochaetaceae bacterium]
ITIQEKYLMAQRLKWNFKNIWVKNLRFPYKKHHQFIETGDITIYKLYMKYSFLLYSTYDKKR